MMVTTLIYAEYTLAIEFNDIMLHYVYMCVLNLQDCTISYKMFGPMTKHNLSYK